MMCHNQDVNNVIFEDDRDDKAYERAVYILRRFHSMRSSSLEVIVEGDDDEDEDTTVKFVKDTSSSRIQGLRKNATHAASACLADLNTTNINPSSTTAMSPTSATNVITREVDDSWTYDFFMDSFDDDDVAFPHHLHHLHVLPNQGSRITTSTPLQRHTMKRTTLHHPSIENSGQLFL